MNISSHMRDESLSKECVSLLNNTLKTMTKRNFTKELLYSYYNDMEGGDDVESIDYRSLIHIITELHNRIEKLEAWKEQAQSSAKSVREHIDFEGCYD
jgi:hypothetical protein